MKKFLKLISLVMVLSMFVSMDVFAFNPDTDAGKYVNEKGTNIYSNNTTTEAEKKEVIRYYNMIPEVVKKLMQDNGIKMYLIGDEPQSGGNGQNGKSEGEANYSLKGLPAGVHPYTGKYAGYDAAPRFIEDDPYDYEKNICIVYENKKPYILCHGYLYSYDGVTPIETVRERLKDIYLADSANFGANTDTYLSGLMTTESSEEETPFQGSTALATSWGPSVEYDADNGYSYVKTVKNGWTQYYSNNAVCLPETIIHEAGHHLDWLSVPLSGNYKGTLFGISDSKEWQQIYAANKNALSSMDALAAINVPMSASEAFADAFRLTYQKPDALKKSCPAVYDFVNRMVSKYASMVVTADNFDYQKYADDYPDLKAAFGYDKNALWNHYNTFGKSENRVISVK